MSVKRVIALLLLTSLIFTQEETEDDPDFSEFDSAEYEKNVDIYFKGESTTATREQAVDLLLITYGETTLHEAEEIEEKSQNEADLEDLDEEILFLKIYIEQFIDERYEGIELTTDTLKSIIRNNEVLEFLEEKMKDENVMMDDDEEENWDHEDHLDHETELNDGLGDEEMDE